MKKTLSLILSILMLLSITAGLDFSAFADEYNGFSYIVSNNEAIIGGYSGSETTLEIPASINGYPVTVITNNAFKSKTEITSVYIPYSVLSIKRSAFYACTGLTSVIIGNSVTSIGEYAFYGCTGLTSIDIPDSVTSIDKNAFSVCTGLTNITFGNNVISIGDYAFGGCTGLTSIDVPDSVTSIGEYAFNQCTGLTSVTIGNNVTSIGDAAFNHCEKLTSIEFSDSVISIGNYAFSECGGLTVIDIPNSVMSIGEYAFSDCSALTSVGIGSGVTSIGTDAFYKCIGLTEVCITDLAAWCNISFSDYFSNPLSYAEQLYLNNELLTELVIPNGITSIGNNVFYHCKCLTKLSIPDSVTSIGDYAFSGCIGLKELIIPDSVTSIGRFAFSGCNGIKNVTIGSGVTSIEDHAFYNCSSISRVDYTGVSIYQWDAITVESDNTDLTDAYIHINHNYRVSDEMQGYITYVCDDCEASFGLYYTVLDDGTVAITDYEESYEIIIPSEINGKTVTAIGDSAFKECTALRHITIPDGVTSIGEYAFYKCTNLTNIVIPNSVTNIGKFAFQNCTYLKSITIGKGVTDIGTSAFDKCGNLKDVYYLGYESEWGNITIGGRNTNLTNANLHYVLRFNVSGYIGYLASKNATEGTLGSHKQLQNVVITTEVDGETVTADYDNATGRFLFTEIPSGTYTATVHYAYGFDRTFRIVVDEADVESETVIGIANCNFNNADKNINSKDLKIINFVGAISGRTNQELYAQYYYLDVNGDNNVNAKDLKLFTAFVGTNGRTFNYKPQTIKNA